MSDKSTTLRFGPYLSKSRKLRRHRIRQWVSKERRDVEAKVIDGITIEYTKDTNLDFMVTKSHAKRTGRENISLNIIFGGEPTGNCTDE